MGPTRFMTDLPPPVSAGVAVWRETSYMSPRKIGKIFLKIANARIASQKGRKAMVRRVRTLRAAAVKAGGRK